MKSFGSNISCLLSSGIPYKEYNWYGKLKKKILHKRISKISFIDTEQLSIMLSKIWISSQEFFNDFVDRFGTTYLNPFIPNALFLYPLKTSENLKIFWCFQGVEKGCIWNEWVKNGFLWRYFWRILLAYFKIATYLQTGSIGKYS